MLASTQRSGDVGAARTVASACAFRRALPAESFRRGNQAHLRRLSFAPPGLQAKLAVGSVDDPLEHEADAAADHVMRMADPSLALSPAPPTINRKCAACEDEDRKAVQRHPDALAGPETAEAPPLVDDVLRTSGRPLDPATHDFMANRFGANFHDVRIHTDADAARSAREVNAHAYTVGRHVVFGAGRYDPVGESGRRLIAHELAHTLQQGGGALRRYIMTPSASDSAEVAGHINTFCPNSAEAVNVSLAAKDCKSPTGPGCECACKALQDTTRTYIVKPSSCSAKNETQTLFDGTSAVVTKSTVYPNTINPSCGSPVPIQIPKAGSAMEFGAFKADGSAFWYNNWRILAHELCGHGVLCQSYTGGTGNREQHDATIDTENAIAGSPVRGHFGDKPPPPGKARQGESFMNKVGDRSKVAFQLVDGWHFEAP